MSTWIFRFAPALLLAGCVGGGLSLGGGEPAVSLTRDQIAVSGPRGFCVDPEATRDDGESGFAVFGNCAAVSGSRLSRQPQTPAVLTAAISAPSEDGGIEGALADLSGFFRSPDGARVLSRSGDPETVEVLQTFVAGEVFYLRATDVSPGVVPGVEDTYWRAYFDIGARIATLSVLAVEGEGTAEAAQLSVLESFVAATIADNPVTPLDTAEPAPGAETDAPAENPGLFNSGFFRRIVGSGQG